MHFSISNVYISLIFFHAPCLFAKLPKRDCSQRRRRHQQKHRGWDTELFLLIAVSAGFHHQISCCCCFCANNKKMLPKVKLQLFQIFKIIMNYVKKKHNALQRSDLRLGNEKVRRWTYLCTLQRPRADWLIWRTAWLWLVRLFVLRVCMSSTVFGWDVDPERRIHLNTAQRESWFSESIRATDDNKQCDTNRHGSIYHLNIIHLKTRTRSCTFL